jgi:hypothetical protein
MMHHQADIPWFVFIPFVIPLGFTIYWFYLMWTKPEKWVEYFMNKPYRWMGLQVTIIDREKFRKITRIYTAIPIFAAIMGLLAALVALSVHHKI